MNYPALCACGHSEWIYAASTGELSYQIETKTRFFCTGCSIGIGREASEKVQREMPWLQWEQKREIVVRTVRYYAAHPDQQEKGVELCLI